MALLRRIVDTITGPPGDIFYHLVTLFAIQLILALACGHWNRRRDSDAGRLLVTGAVLALARIPVFAVALLHRTGAISSALILPPLERFLDLSILLVMIWAFLPILVKHRRLGTVLLAGTLLVTGGAYAASAVLWPQAAAQDITYGSYWQGTAWELCTISILVFAVVGDLVWREYDWALLGYLLFVSMGGHILELALPTIGSDAPGWVRLSGLVTLPLLASLVYRQALNATGTQDGGIASELATLLKATERIEAARDTETALGMASSAIARSLGADVVATGVPLTGPRAGIRIVGLHPPTDTVLAQEEPILLKSRFPLLAAVLETNRAQAAHAPHKDPSISALYGSLGLDNPGPLLLQPVLDKDDLLGMLVIGNPRSRRHFVTSDMETAEAVAAAIAVSVTRSRQNAVVDRSKELATTTAEARRLSQMVARLEGEVQAGRQRADELETRLRLRNQEPPFYGLTTTSTSALQREIQKLEAVRVALAGELGEWRERAGQLARSEAELQEQLEEMRTGRRQAEGVSASSAPPGPRSSGKLGSILTGDEQGNVSSLSHGAERLIGKQRSALIGVPVRSLFAEPLWVRAVERLSCEETKGGDTATVTLDISGQMTRAEVVRFPVTAGHPATLVVTLYPEDGPMLQSDAVDSLAQGIRSPLTAIVGYTDLLMDETMGILGNVQQQFLERISVSAERIGELLDLVKVTTVCVDKSSTTSRCVSVASVAEDAVSSRSAQLIERDLSVQIDIPSDLRPVGVDRDNLVQILQHLISWASQRSRLGGEIQIGAQLRQRDGQAEDALDYLLVTVTGAGRSALAEDQRQVLEIPDQARNLGDAGEDEEADENVGLSVAKALVEAHNGRNWIEYDADESASFSFVLPLLSEDGEGTLPDDADGP